jgi:hypothetical protein
MNVQASELLKCVSKVVKINCALPGAVDFLDVCSVSREWKVSASPLLEAACACVKSSLEGILGVNATVS